MTGILVPVGIYCLAIAVQRDWSALPVAAIPFLFGVQQFCEGIVWVGIGRGDSALTRIAATWYLFFALAFWLFWIPFSAVFLEPRRIVRYVFGFAALLGSIGGAILFLPLVLNPLVLVTTAVHHSINYDYGDHIALKIAPQVAWHLLYLSVISMPFFLLKDKLLIGFSTALIVSAIISHTVFIYAFESIWCIFAAVLSLYLGYLFHQWPQRQIDQARI